jgi:hypothetical protein
MNSGDFSFLSPLFSLLLAVLLILFDPNSGYFNLLLDYHDLDPNHAHELIIKLYME